MLVCHHLLEQFRMTTEVKKDGEPTGNYDLHKNALERLICLYGDALSVANWNQCYPIFMGQMSQPVRQKFIKKITKAFDMILLQKGLFHQGMHQTAVIYTGYCGGFLQPIQVALGVKRVIGDSV